MRKSENYYFWITIAAICVKVAWSIQLNELIKDHSDFKVKTCYSQKQLCDLEPKLIWKFMGEWEWKFIQMSWVSWPTWPPCTYMVKILQNLLLQNQLTDDLESWYVALSIQVLPRLLKLWHWVDLDLFYANVKSGHIGFSMGKSVNYYYFGNYYSIRSQSCLKHSTKWDNEVEWVSGVVGWCDGAG